MSKHTPGPWEWYEIETDEIVPAGKYGDWVRGGISLRTTYAKDPLDKHFPELPYFIISLDDPLDNPGDMALLKAAPDLLEACEKFVEAMTPECHHNIEGMNVIMLEAMLAIDKAKGDSDAE